MAWQPFKNTASQVLELFAFDYSTGAPKTGDAANLTAYVTIDGDASPDVLTDTSATEKSSTNAPGWYQFDLTQGETNGDHLLYSGKSSTGNVAVIGIDTNSRLATADVNVTQIAGSTSAATHLKDHAPTAVPVTFDNGGSTTTAVLVNVDGATASSVDDIYNGRILIFTAPSSGKHEATDITDYVGSTKTVTITQITFSPDNTATAILV